MENPIPEHFKFMSLDFPFAISRTYLIYEIMQRVDHLLDGESSENALNRALYMLSYENQICSYEEGTPATIIFYRPGITHGFK
jgi:hypothetical protein